MFIYNNKKNNNIENTNKNSKEEWIIKKENKIRFFIAPVIVLIISLLISVIGDIAYKNFLPSTAFITGEVEFLKSTWKTLSLITLILYILLIFTFFFKRARQTMKYQWGIIIGGYFFSTIYVFFLMIVEFRIALL